MRTRGLVVVALAAAACSGPRPRQATGNSVLSVQGRVSGGPSRFGASDLKALPRRTFRGRDPRGGEEAAFEGVLLHKLLGDVLELEKGSDVAIFQGKDGFEVAIPISVLRQLRPVLADRIDGAPVEQARPAAAPLVLAWPTLEAPGLATDPRARWWWVDGVTKVDIRSWLATYGRALRVPPGAPADARPGAEAFQSSCMMCHRVRGVGGTRGPDLTEKLSTPVAQDGFATALRGHANRPDAAAAAELAPAALRDISSFLRVVALSGRLPADEPVPEPPDTEQRPPGAVGPGRPPGM